MNKRIIINLCKYGLAVGLLTWVIWKNWRPTGQPGLGDIWDKHVVEGKPIPHPEFFFLALALCLASVLLSFVRWFVLVRAVGLPFRLSDALRLGMVGYFFNNFLPGSIGGDVLKAAFLAREQDRRTVAVATVVMDRMIALWALIWFVAILGCGFWLAGQFQGDTAEESQRIVIGAVAICAVSLTAWLLLGFLPAGRAERFAQRLNRLRKIGHSAAEFWRAVWMYRCRQRSVYLAMLMAFVGFFGFVFTFYFAVRTLAEPTERIPTVEEHFLVIPIGFVIQALPGLPGGLGLGEWGFGEMYARMQCASSLGVLGSLVQRVIFWILGLAGYLIYLRMKPSLETEQEKAEELTKARVGAAPASGLGDEATPRPAEVSSTRPE
ncbi:MAG TPA: lysylphosphatidylglycerol synthase transmembrane domain-containing protein [Gemmataceae bacterium]